MSGEGEGEGTWGSMTRHILSSCATSLTLQYSF